MASTVHRLQIGPRFMRELLLDVNLALFKIDTTSLEPRQFTDPQARVSRGLNQDACRISGMTR